MHYNVSVSNASLKIAGLPAQRTAAAWAAGTAYAVGDYVLSNRRIYMAITAGTASTTAPVGVGVCSDGAVSWVSMLHRPRKGITIINEGSITAYISMGAAAVALRGAALTGEGGSITLSGDSAVQCEFYAIRAAATAGNIAVLEW